VLLHGFLGSGRNLRSLAQRWAAREPDRRLLVPDLTGHGASPPLPPGADLSTLAGDVLETVEAAGLVPPLTLVGHSLGGRVALAAARRAAVSDLVLLDIAPGPIEVDRGSGRVLDILLAAPEEAPSRRDLRQHLVLAGLSGETADWLAMNVRVEDGRARWTFDRQALGRLQEKTSAEDLWDVVEGRRIAVRCIRGGRSQYVQEADVRRLEAAGCSVQTLAGSGHEVHVEAIDALLDALASPPAETSP
jgi:pimeloyl-ACP methyl ester carboxylesterase